MPILCDANALLALSYNRHIHHEAALAWLNPQGRGEVAICRSTQLSLLRLLCNASVMDRDVCTMVQAWGIYDAILADDRFQFCAEPADLGKTLRQLTQSNRASAKLWQDAYLAAFAITVGFQMVTLLDRRCFREIALFASRDKLDSGKMD